MGYNLKTDIICLCNTYPKHPHRLGGGKCTGAAWCISYRAIDSYECDTCLCNSNGQCEIVTGQEVISKERCTCIADELRTRYLEDEYGYLPLDVEDYWEKQQREYYEHK